MYRRQQNNATLAAKGSIDY